MPSLLLLLLPLACASPMYPDVPDGAIDARDDAAPPGWRSELYPADWLPPHAGGSPTTDGRFLHDFSFAGYHRGDDAPPTYVGTVRQRLDAATFGDGAMDATAALQSAIDTTCAAGGGVVALSAGTFRVRFPTATATAAIRIACSNLVLRGVGASGAAVTRVFLDDQVARSRSLLLVHPTTYSAWTGSATRPERAFTRDAISPTRTIALADVTGFAPGDDVVARTDVTPAFRAEHRMDAANTGMGDFWPSGTSTGLMYFRRVVSVDAAARTLNLDAPTRYQMRTRDNARTFETSGFVREVGLEDFAIGMREHATSATGTMPGPLGDAADNAYDTAGTAAYDVHGSAAVRFEGVQDSWVVRVRTYAPAGNASGAHVLSIGLFLTDSVHRVTVSDCQFDRPQYRGGGGNGYMFLVQGSDNLLMDNRATAGRHNFITASVTSSGNVFLRNRTTDSRSSDDSHRQLSQANLYDSMELDRAWLQAVNRGTTSNGAGHTATQTVFWNTQVLAVHQSTVRAGAGFPMGFAVETAQWNLGYVIGTRGPTADAASVATTVLTNSYWATLDPGLPRDFVEGIARGATLVPQSLYDDQLRLRRARGE